LSLLFGFLKGTGLGPTGECLLVILTVRNKFGEKSVEHDTAGEERREARGRSALGPLSVVLTRSLEHSLSPLKKWRSPCRASYAKLHYELSLLLSDVVISE